MTFNSLEDLAGCQEVFGAKKAASSWDHTVLAVLTSHPDACLLSVCRALTERTQVTKWKLAANLGKWPLGGRTVLAEPRPSQHFPRFLRRAWQGTEATRLGARPF